VHSTANACSQCCHLLLICVVKCFIDSSSPSAAPLCVPSMSMLREWSSESSLDNLQDICGVRKVISIKILHRSTSGVRNMRSIQLCSTPEPSPLFPTSFAAMRLASDANMHFIPFCCFDCRQLSVQLFQFGCMIVPLLPNELFSVHCGDHSRYR